MSNVTLFTSESVCEGHPDKLCDAISDALLDACLEQDPNTRAGIETVAGANQISLFGEITTTAKIDHGKIVTIGTAEQLKKQTKTNSLEEAFLKLTGSTIREEQSSGVDHLRSMRRMWSKKQYVKRRLYIVAAPSN